MTQPIVGQTIVFRRLPSVRFVGQTIVFRRLPSAPNRQTTKYDGLPHRAESGYAMLLVFLMAALIAIALYSELPRVAFEAQRTKEQLLIERGEQYKRAIQLFVRKMSRYPATIEELENTNNVRFLRKRYIDPMTGKDKWRLIHINGGVLTDSIVPKQNPNAPPGQQGDQPPQNTNTFIGEGPVMGAGNDPNQQQINPALRRRASDDRPTVEQEAANNPQQDADNSDDNADNAADNNDNNNNGDDNPAPGAPNANANVPGAQNPNTPGFPGRIPQPGMQNGTFPGQPGFNPALANQNLGQPGMPTPGINPGFPGAGNTTNNGQSSDPSSSSGVYAAPSLGSSAANATPTPTYPGQPGGFPGQPGFQNQPGGFPGRPGMFPGQPGGFPGQPGAFPGQGGGIQSGGFQSGGGLQSGGFNPGQTAGGINPQAGQNNAFSNNFGLNGPSNIQQNAPGGMGGTQMGGGIAGVASEFKGPTIKIYNDRKKYNEWEFVYDQSKDKGLAGVQRGGGAPGTPAGQMGSMPPGPGQPGSAFGGNSNGSAFGGNSNGSAFGSGGSTFGSPGGSAFGSPGGSAFGSQQSGFGQPQPQQPQPQPQQPQN